MKTTLNKIRDNSPCELGWKKLLNYLGKTKADDEPLLIRTIVESNGLEDALWCLRAVEGHDKEIRLYAVWCARQVQHLMKDQRSVAALDISEKYAHGDATQNELAAASAAAWAAADASRDAASAAADAAWAAADASRDAADASRDAASAAADAAWAAAGVAQKAELLRICDEIKEKNT